MLHSFDLETHLVQPGLMMPPVVCGSTACWEQGPDSARFLSREEAFAEARRLLTDPTVTLAGANVAFDMGCLANEEPELLPLIFAAYDAGRIFDIQVSQALDAIAGGHLFCEPDGRQLRPEPGKKKARYSLATCVRLTLGREDAKANDLWRMRYAILQHVPLARWPWEAKQYPRDDAWNTVECAAAHLGLHGINGRTPYRNLSDHADQVAAAFALHLGAAWGIRTDRERFDALTARIAPQIVAFTERYTKLGWLRADGSENSAVVKRAVALAYMATGDCSACRGSGKNLVPCKGRQLRKGGRFQGCKSKVGNFIREHCEACGGSSQVPGLTLCKVCDGTGLDLDTATTLPRAEKGGVSTARDTLAESGDEALHDYGDNEFLKVHDSYLPALANGLDVPENLRPNVLVASGRTSYDGVWQLMPRSCAGCALRRRDLCTCVRPCVRARDGYVLFSVDHSAGELVTLSEVCKIVVGSSVMMDTINRMKDPGALHTALGGKMLGISEAEAFARYAAKDDQMARFRQAAKPFNFGAPGGMGEAKLVLTNRKKAAGTTVGPDGRVYAGIRFCILVGGAKECGAVKVTSWKRKPCPPTCKACLELAAMMRATWFEQWPEMRAYFEWVSSNVELNGELPCFGPWAFENGAADFPEEWLQLTHRVRGGLAFCDGANNGFQAMLADATKRALWVCTREAYTDTSSPLYKGRARFVIFAHDELFGEVLAEWAHEATHRIAEVMRDMLGIYAPHVFRAAEPTTMHYWYKDAKPVYRDGRLVPWEPK